MSMGPGTGEHAAHQDPAAVPAQPCLAAPRDRPPPGRPCPDNQAPAGEQARPDIDAYINRLVRQAPTLSSEQRDKLALILRGQRRR